MIDWTNPLTILASVRDKIGVDYRITGLAATNLYGYGLPTNVIEVALQTRADLYSAIKNLLLGEPTLNGDNQLAWLHEYEGGKYTFYIKLRVEELGEPFLHPLGVKLHEKKHVMEVLEPYVKMDSRVRKAIAFCALTLDPEKTEKYKEYWNRL